MEVIYGIEGLYAQFSWSYWIVHVSEWYLCKHTPDKIEFLKKIHFRCIKCFIDNGSELVFFNGSDEF